MHMRDTDRVQAKFTIIFVHVLGAMRSRAVMQMTIMFVMCVCVPSYVRCFDYIFTQFAMPLTDSEPSQYRAGIGYYLTIQIIIMQFKFYVDYIPELCLPFG